MNYKLEITRTEPNPDYKKSQNFNDVYRQPYDVPEYSTFQALSVEITPEQFEAIRKAVLEAF